MADAALTAKIRIALRRSVADTGITAEIEDDIAACKKELQEVGVINLSDTDALIIRACVLHARASFDFEGKGAEFRQSFDSLKHALSMAADYIEAPESE